MSTPRIPKGKHPTRPDIEVAVRTHGAKRPGSLRNRLDERDIADLLTAYREGVTAASLAAAQGNGSVSSPTASSSDWGSSPTRVR